MENATAPAAELRAVVGAVSCRRTREEGPPPTTSICPAMDSSDSRVVLRDPVVTSLVKAS